MTRTRNLISLTCRQKMDNRIAVVVVASIATNGTTLWGDPPPRLSAKTAGLENDIFDNTGAHDAAMFHCSLKSIADCIQLNYVNKVSKAITKMTRLLLKSPWSPVISRTRMILIQLTLTSTYGKQSTRRLLPSWISTKLIWQGLLS